MGRWWQIETGDRLGDCQTGGTLRAAANPYSAFMQILKGTLFLQTDAVPNQGAWIGEQSVGWISAPCTSASSPMYAHLDTVAQGEPEERKLGGGGHR